MSTDGLPHQVAELKMTSDCLLMASDYPLMSTDGLPHQVALVAAFDL